MKINNEYIRYPLKKSKDKELFKDLNRSIRKLKKSNIKSINNT